MLLVSVIFAFYLKLLLIDLLNFFEGIGFFKSVRGKNSLRNLVVFFPALAQFGYSNRKSCAVTRRTVLLDLPAVNIHHLLGQKKAKTSTTSCAESFFEKKSLFFSKTRLRRRPHKSQSTVLLRFFAMHSYGRVFCRTSLYYQ